MKKVASKGYESFCKKIADGLGLILSDEYYNRPLKSMNATTMRSTMEGQVFDIYMLASDLTAYSVENARTYYLAELYSNDGHYLGAIDQDGDSEFEHFEVAVSPTGNYLDDGNPCDEEGTEIQGELWVFKQSKRLGDVIKSFKAGGSRQGRKPIQIL